jgi:hypothetical protein
VKVRRRKSDKGESRKKETIVEVWAEEETIVEVWAEEETIVEVWAEEETIAEVWAEEETIVEVWAEEETIDCLLPPRVVRQRAWIGRLLRLLHSSNRCGRSTSRTS